MLGYDATSIMAILPEILLLLTGVLVLIYEPFWNDETQHRYAGWLTFGGLLTTMAVSLLFARPGAPQAVFGGMVRYDWLGFAFKMFFIFAAAMTTLFFMDHEKLGARGQAYVLLIAATIGMNLMASAADLVMLYLAIETTSIPLYVLSGFMKDDDASTEAGFKYLLFGAMTSAVMLYGFSLLFGFTGTTDLYALTGMLTSGQLPAGTAFGLILLVTVGLGFKVALFPFHFWTPDVYQGAPTPVAAFLSTASKAAGFAVFARLFMVAFSSMAFSAIWINFLAILAAVTMTIGNLIALGQKDVKRLLAYSSIAHAGYAMIGLVAFSKLGIQSVVFYLIAYIFTNLAAFGAVAAFERVTGTTDIAAFAGLSRRASTLALVLLAAFLSLAGMPPFGGFVAKVFVFAAAVKSGLIWLAIVGVLNSIVGVYYYLTFLKVVYLYRSEDEDKPMPIPRAYLLALVVLSIGVVLIGTVFAPWFGLSGNAAIALF